MREIESIVIEQQAEEIKLLREELMVAVLHVCNYYHWDGHYKRVPAFLDLYIAREFLNSDDVRDKAYAAFKLYQRLESYGLLDSVQTALQFHDIMKKAAS